MRKLLLVTVIILYGCTTKAMWEPEYRSEQIDGFYYNNDRKELLVSTRSSGYIFQVDQKFGEVLALSRRITFKPMFDKFILDRENSVTGTVTLTLYDKNINNQDINKLKSLGFKSGYANKLKMVRQLQGSRYKIDGKLPFERLEKTLTVKIVVPDSYTKVAGKIIASPVAITLDVAGYIVVIPIIAYMMVITEVAGP